jgi:hypothetical protein
MKCATKKEQAIFRNNYIDFKILKTREYVSSFVTSRGLERVSPRRGKYALPERLDLPSSSKVLAFKLNICSFYTQGPAALF